MLSKNNFKEKLRKMSAKKERFSIRKFSVGAASVLIGLTFMGMSSQSVKADTTAPSNDQAEQNTADEARDAVHNSKAVTLNNGNVKDDSQNENTDSNVASISDAQKSENTEPEENNSGAKTDENAEIQTVKTADLESGTVDADTVEEDKTTKSGDNSKIKSLMDDLANSAKKESSSENKEDPDKGIQAENLLEDSKVTAGSKATDTNTDNKNDDQNVDNFVTGDWQLGTLDTTNNTIAVTGYTGAKSGNTTTTEYYIPNASAFRADTNLGLNEDTQVTIDYDVLRGLVTDGATKIITEAPSNDENIKNDQLLVTGTFGTSSNSLSFMFTSRYDSAKGTNDFSDDDVNGVKAFNRNSPNGSLKYVDVSGLNIGAATTISDMFNDDQALETVKGLQNWDISNVTNIGHMFYNDISLSEVDGLDKWDVANSKITMVDNMFNVSQIAGKSKANTTDGDRVLVDDTTPKLKSLTLNWTINNASNLYYMFAGQSALTTIGDTFIVHSSNTASDIGYMKHMFDGSGITKLDMSGSTFKEGYNVTDMFANLVNPATIVLNNVTGATSLKASDFAGNQPLIVISDNSNIQALNDNGGHAANTVTFQDETGATVATQQQKFVFANEDALNTALAAIPNMKNVKVNADVNSATPNLGDVVTGNVTWKSGWTDSNSNAVQPNTYGEDTDYGKIAGTYAVTAQTQDVTNDAKRDPVTVHYQVIERVPSKYASELGATGSTNDNGTVNKALVDQTITGYKTTLKNLLTGKEIPENYYTVGDLNVENNGTVTPTDATYFSSKPIDEIAGYHITATPQSYQSDGYTDNNTQGAYPHYYVLTYSANTNTYKFTYDFIAGTQESSKNVTFNEFPPDQTFYIDYVANSQSITYNFEDVDDNDKVVSSQKVDGVTDETVDPSNTVKVPDNYVLVDQNGNEIPTSYTFKPSDNGPITLYVKHATKEIDEDQIPDGAKNDNNTPLTKENFEKEEKRTITAKEPTGDVDLSQSTTLTRTAILDKVTNTVTKWNDWSTSKFDSVDVPQVPGYTAQIDGENAEANIPAVDSVTSDYEDPNIIITYSPNEQKTEIIYVDDNGVKIGDPTQLNGVTDQTVDVNPQVPTGYWIDPQAQTTPIPTTYTFKASDNQPIKIVVTKKQDSTVPPTTDDKQVGVIVEYKTPDGKVVGTDVVSATPGEKIQVGTNIPEGYKGNPQEYTVPADGGTVTIPVTQESSLPPTTDDKPVGVIVEYKTPDGKVVGTDVVSAIPGKKIQVGTNIPEGYEGSSQEYAVPDDGGTVTIEVTKKPDGSLPPTTDNKPVGIIVNYTDPDGNVISSQVVSGTPGETIKVGTDIPAGYTGEAQDYTVPTDGGIVNIPITKISTPDVVPDDGDTIPTDDTVTVTVNYKDKDGNIIGTEIITGKPGETITVGTNIPAGYTGSSEQYTIPEGGGVVDINVDKPAADATKPDDNKAKDDFAVDTDTTATQDTEKHNQAAKAKAKKSSSDRSVKGEGYNSNSGVKGASLNAGPKSATSSKGEFMKSDDKTLPQTGEDNAKAVGFLGTILAVMGITTALGAKKRKKD